MEREVPFFSQVTVVAGEPVDTQVRVRAVSLYVRLVMLGSAEYKEKH